MKRWIQNIRFIAPVLLVLSGTFLLSGGTLFDNTGSNGQTKVAALTPAKPKPAPKVTIQGIPTRIVVPAEAIDLQVDKGYYNETTRTWSLSGTHAQYAVMTAQANNVGGNTFIYGHNNHKVFGKLLKIKAGDVVIIYTDNGHKFYYSYRTESDVKPDDTSLFNYQGPPILTVQTCSGAWYQNRRLFVFDLIRVE
ncbi:MAG TPA: sortase [Candidatus Saccharimonadales bacterium]|nr:sortase [Candidatus Saccharimonadales bacterium]